MVKEKKKKKKITIENFRLKPFLIGLIRKSFKNTPMYRDVKDKAKRVVEITLSNGKTEKLIHYECTGCKRLFREKGVEECVNDSGVVEKKKFTARIAVDHVHGVIDPHVGWVDFNTFIDRHFWGELQVLCNYKGLIDGEESCHAIKTRAEMKISKQTNKNKKDEK